MSRSHLAKKEKRLAMYTLEESMFSSLSEGEEERGM